MAFRSDHLLSNMPNTLTVPSSNSAAPPRRNILGPSRTTRVWGTGESHLRGLWNASSARVSADTAAYLDHLPSTADHYRPLQNLRTRAQDSFRNVPESIQSYMLFCNTCHPSSSIEGKTSFLPSRTCYPEHSSNIRRPSSNGTLLHTRAMQHFTKEGIAWKCGSRGIQQTVVTLDEDYFTHAHIAHCGDPKINARRPCGCSRVGIGCANCGSPLGIKMTYCATANEQPLAESSMALEARIATARMQSSYLRNLESTHFNPILTVSEVEILTFASQGVLDDMYPQSMSMTPGISQYKTECFTFFPDAVVAITAALLSLPPNYVNPVSLRSIRQSIERSNAIAATARESAPVSPVLIRRSQEDLEPPPTLSIPRLPIGVSTSLRLPQTLTSDGRISWTQVPDAMRQHDQDRGRQSVARQLADLDPLSPELHNNPVNDIPPLQYVSDSDEETHRDFVNEFDGDDFDFWLSDHDGARPRVPGTSGLPLPPRDGTTPVLHVTRSTEEVNAAAARAALRSATTPWNHPVVSPARRVATGTSLVVQDDELSTPQARRESTGSPGSSRRDDGRQRWYGPSSISRRDSRQPTSDYAPPMTNEGISSASGLWNFVASRDQNTLYGDSSEAEIDTDGEENRG